MSETKYEIGKAGATLFSILSFIAACKVFIWLGNFAKEPDKSDLFYEHIKLATGEITIVHRGGCRYYRTERRLNKREYDEYIREYDHYYCYCLEEETMDRMSKANYARQMVLDDWCYEVYPEYQSEIYKRMKDIYYGGEGRELVYVYTKEGYKEATHEDWEMLREIWDKRFDKVLRH